MMQCPPLRQLERGTADLQDASLRIIHHDVVPFVDSDINLVHRASSKQSLAFYGSLEVIRRCGKSVQVHLQISHRPDHHLRMRRPLELRFWVIRHNDAVVQVSIVLEDGSATTPPPYEQDFSVGMSTPIFFMATRTTNFAFPAYWLPA